MSPTGWLSFYTTDGETIGDNEFTIEDDVTITCDRRPNHFSQSGDTFSIHTADGEILASSNSTTFASGWNATIETTNSYYTQAFGVATLYAAENKTVNLALGHTVPAGLSFNGYIVSPEGVTLTPNGNNYTLTMGNANVVINASLVGFLTYIDEKAGKHPRR